MHTAKFRRVLDHKHYWLQQLTHVSATSSSVSAMVCTVKSDADASLQNYSFSCFNQSCAASSGCIELHCSGCCNLERESWPYAWTIHGCCSASNADSCFAISKSTSVFNMSGLLTGKESIINIIWCMSDILSYCPVCTKQSDTVCLCKQECISIAIWVKFWRLWWTM